MSRPIRRPLALFERDRYGDEIQICLLVTETLHASVPDQLLVCEAQLAVLPEKIVSASVNRIFLGCEEQGASHLPVDQPRETRREENMSLALSRHIVPKHMVQGKILGWLWTLLAKIRIHLDT